MNEEKIVEEARWDGLQGIITNDKEALACVESSILYDGNGHRYKVPSKLNEYAQRIYRAAAVPRQVKAEKMEYSA